MQKNLLAHAMCFAATKEINSENCKVSSDVFITEMSQAVIRDQLRKYEVRGCVKMVPMKNSLLKSPETLHL